MHFRRFIVFTFFLLAILPHIQGQAASELHDRSFKLLLPFSLALETLQKQLGYTFKNIDLLRRAMTHASFSLDNNKALSIMGASVIETSVSLQSLVKDFEISAEDLNRQIVEVSKVETSCAVDGMRLGLHKVIRISSRTNSSTPSVVCGAFRAIFGAIAIDTGKSDDAGKIFWSVHGGQVGGALVF